ncbi:MAG: ribosome small subunit-dependent GTPase A [Treponema sp.]|nr:ribosome small subunit-dependent GTPase A [Candidatus Treponema caballi]
MNTTITARVICVQKNLYSILCGEMPADMHAESVPGISGSIIDAKLKGKFYNLQLEPPVVGDYVTAEINEYGDGLISEVLPRKTVFKRPNRSGHAEAFVKNLLEETVVSNFDYVFIVTSLNQNYNENRIARFVTLTLQAGAKPVVILSKADLSDDVDLKVEITKAVCEKADVIACSSKTGFGLDTVRAYLEPGKTIALLGSSGVGKSTLLNTLSGQDLMKVNAIRDEDGKGRHTTTYRQLFQLSCGTWIMDTPGMRELGIIDAEEGLEEAFSDVTSLFSQCKFSDCSHTNEPGCAVLAALADGTLSFERWEMYAKLHTESEWGKEKMKAIARFSRNLDKRVRRGEY